MSSFNTLAAPYEIPVSELSSGRIGLKTQADSTLVAKRNDAILRSCLAQLTPILRCIVEAHPGNP